MIKAFREFHNWFSVNSITGRPKITISCNGDPELKARIGLALRKEFHRNMLVVTDDQHLYSGTMLEIPFEVVD